MEATLSIKHCPCCNLTKNGDAFSPDRRNKDGLNYRCKSCHSLHVYNKYQVNPEPARLAIKKYRESLCDHSA